MSDLVVVLTTFPADQDAEAFAGILVDAGLAACVNALPVMRSIYKWKGATERADERQLIIKTTAHCLPDLESKLRESHPYDVPEFIVLPVSSASLDYASWLTENTQPK